MIEHSYFNIISGKIWWPKTFGFREECVNRKG